MSGIKDAKRRQQRRRRKKKIQRLTVIFGSLFLILLLVFAVRGISHKINEKEKKAEKKTTVKKEKIDTSHVKVKNLVINTKDRGSLRIGIGYFNTKDNIDKLVEALNNL